jgi:hypothetical protein
MANLDHVLILPGEAVFAAGRYRRVRHERRGSRTPRRADDALGSASGKRTRHKRHMSISGPNMPPSPPPRPGAARPGHLQPERGETPRAAGGAGGAAHGGGIDALIALQGLQDPTERRKQGVKRGRLALDALDEFKIALLGGILSQVALLEGRWPRWRARRDRTPGRGRDRQDGGALAHVPEKWKPVFRTEHAQNQRIQD